MLLNEDPTGYRGDRGVRGAQGGAGGFVRMAWVWWVKGTSRSVPLRCCNARTPFTRKIRGKAWTWAARRPCLRTLHLDEQQVTDRKKTRAKVSALTLCQANCTT